MKRIKWHTLFMLSMVSLMVFLGGKVSFAENIDPDNDGSQYAYGENVGWLNAEPLGDGGPGVAVDDTKLTGYIWAENIGWVSLSCENTESCGTVDYGVTNDGSGHLAGYAWAENVGWISFSCENTDSCDTVDYGVTIDPATGAFSGHAWGENIGWVTLRSTGAVPFGVTTSWTSGVTQPVPDIKANGFDGPIDVSPGDPVSIDVHLDAGDISGQDADWWVVAETPFGWYYYNLTTTTWLPGFISTHQGALFSLPSYYNVLNSSNLPVGTYVFYFGVDMNMNGQLDMGQIYFDFVSVTIQ